MAGMLPGVEAARRRRVHHSSGITSSSSCHSPRRSSFSLFAPNSCTSLSPQPQPQPRSSRTYQYQQDDEKLGSLAREARERLDEKLRSKKKPLFTRNNNNNNDQVLGNQLLRRQVYGSSRSSSKKKRLIIGWAKLGWKSEEQEECAVCLDEFQIGENLVNLPCAHRFHSTCVLPWLHTNAYCPCCRISIFS